MDNLLRNIFNKLNDASWVDCEDRTPRAESCVECQQLQYFNGNSVSYDCVEKRKLYVLRYLPVHAAENKASLRRLPADVVEEILNWNMVRVLSIGGGPGSDLHAVLNFLDESVGDKHRPKIIMTRVDIEPQWDRMAKKVIEDAESECGFDVNSKNVHADVMDALESLDGGEFDLVLCSYLISELVDVEFGKLGKKLKGLMWKGGVLVVNDRPQDEVSEKVRKIFLAAGIEISEASNSGWANYRFDQDIAKKVGPKFVMNSRCFWGINK